MERKKVEGCGDLTAAMDWFSFALHMMDCHSLLPQSGQENDSTEGQTKNVQMEMGKAHPRIFSLAQPKH